MPALALFVIAFAVRVALQAGFIMGDDVNVVVLVDAKRASLQFVPEQVNMRFGVWVPYLLSGKLFGPGELGFFMPTWIISSSFASVAYVLLRRNGYSKAGAVFGGLFVALSPFEILIGTSFANDIFLAGVLVYGYLAWQRRDESPKVSGILIGVLLWFGFFNKAWIVYVAPFLGIELLRDVWGRRRIAFWSSIAVSSVLLQAATAYMFLRALGEPLPWLKELPANYPVPAAEMTRVLLTYPKHLFLGDPDTDTPLFGLVPYLWLLGLGAVVFARGARAVFRDRFGNELLVMWLGMFLLINFVPNALSLSEYRSAPRIFRYLAPISFFLSLHTAKLLLDVRQYGLGAMPARGAALCALLLLGTNVLWAVWATAPGRQNRRIVEDVAAAVRAQCPPMLIMESWQGYFFKRMYLRESCPQMQIVQYPSNGADVLELEQRLREQERDLPAGAMLVTGLGNFVYYPCHTCTIDPSRFRAPLSAGWELVRTTDPITFKPTPIEVKVWRWRRPPEAHGN
jgi:hypothetical protein